MFSNPSVSSFGITNSSALSGLSRHRDNPLIGQDGNIFNLMGIASRTLRQNGMADEAKEMCERICSSRSYDDALCILGEYVNITSGPTHEATH